MKTKEMNPENQLGIDIMGEGAPKKSSKLLYVIGTLIIIAAVSYTIYDFFGMGDKTASIATPTTTTTTTTDTPTPTTTTSHTLDKSNLSITVLNGSGVAGAASAMQTTLENAGYTVSSTGNADSYDYDQTEIHVSSDNKDYLPLLKQALSGSYTIGTADSDYSGSGAEIIVGKE